MNKMEMQTTQVTFEVPTREQVSEKNQANFDYMVKNYGMVPNLYATFAWNDTALTDYLELQGRKSTLSTREREIINLIVSEVNNCDYCRRAHSAVAKMGKLFNDTQLMEIRKAEITFDPKFKALGQFVKETTIKRGRPSDATVNALFDAGYNNANMIDIIMVIGDKIMSNYIHNITHVDIEFPEVETVFREWQIIPD